MKKFFFSALFLFGNGLAVFAQKDESTFTKKWNHSIGVQMNQLIQQVFNFSNTTNAVNNPFLLIYHLHSIKSGWGLRLGVGYHYQSFTDDDGINRRETDMNDVSLRMGAEKLFHLSDKWIAGVGADGILNIMDNKTHSLLRSFDTTITDTDSRLTGYGGGVMAWLRYSISSKIQIGTETSFYFTSGNNNQEIGITKRDFNLPGSPYTTTITSSETKVAEGIFRVPVAIYLLIKI